jgi:hypothetical protein
MRRRAGAAVEVDVEVEYGDDDGEEYEEEV